MENTVLKFSLHADIKSPLKYEVVPVCSMLIWQIRHISCVNNTQYKDEKRINTSASLMLWQWACFNPSIWKIFTFTLCTILYIVDPFSHKDVFIFYLVMYKFQHSVLICWLFSFFNAWQVQGWSCDDLLMVPGSVCTRFRRNKEDGGGWLSLFLS